MSSGTDIVQHTLKRYLFNRLNTTSPATDDIVTRTAISCSWSKSDVTNPRWRSQVRMVRQAGTNFSGTRQSVIYTPYSATAEWLGSGDFGVNPPWHPCIATCIGQAENISTGQFLALPSDSSTVLNRARARFIQQAREANRAIQSGVSAGELGETLRMIRSPAKALREGIPRLFEDVKKRTRRGTSRAKAREIAAETWLEYSFGWAPLVNDVRDGIDYLQRRGKPLLSQTQYVRGSDFSIVPSAQTAVEITPFASLVTQKVTYNQNVIHHIFYGVVGIKDVQRRGGDASLLGLTWSDVPSTAWELIPWSFLIDYFTNVGSVIDSWAFNTSQLRWKCHTARLVSENVRRYALMPERVKTLINASTWQKFQSAYGSPGAMVFRNSSVSRDIMPDLLVSLTFQIPGTSTKWTNIAALLSMRRGARAHYSRLG